MGRKKNNAVEVEACYRFIGAKIQQIRMSLGWSQEELAQKVTLDRTSIVNIEGGKQRIPLHDIETFSRVFNTTPKHLLRGVWF
jgi:transcriptional regulator with XRE-family HTH domain